MFPIEHIVQFDLEHRGDYVWALFKFYRGAIKHSIETDLYRTGPCRQQEEDCRGDTEDMGMRDRQQVTVELKN